MLDIAQEAEQALVTTKQEIVNLSASTEEAAEQAKASIGGKLDQLEDKLQAADDIE